METEEWRVQELSLSLERQLVLVEEVGGSGVRYLRSEVPETLWQGLPGLSDLCR